jgi:hypothetical protein
LPVQSATRHVAGLGLVMHTPVEQVLLVQHGWSLLPQATHCPPEQIVPEAQHTDPQSARPSLHEALHCPAAHAYVPLGPGLAQTRVHAPQLFLSVLVSVQVPLQFVCPVAQHFPDWHDPEQMAPQLPQFCRSLL